MARKMDEETKKWLTFNHSPGEKESLLQQVTKAEEQGLYQYTLDVPSASYEIENGIIRGSVKKKA
jgi:hypothetical protein